MERTRAPLEHITLRMEGGKKKELTFTLFTPPPSPPLVCFRWLFVCAGTAVKVYSTISHELVHTLSHHDEEVTSCCVNPANSLQVCFT